MPVKATVVRQNRILDDVPSAAGLRNKSVAIVAIDCAGYHGPRPGATQKNTLPLICRHGSVNNARVNKTINTVARVCGYRRVIDTRGAYRINAIPGIAGIDGVRTGVSGYRTGINGQSAGAIVIDGGPIAVCIVSSERAVLNRQYAVIIGAGAKLTGVALHGAVAELQVSKIDNATRPVRIGRGVIGGPVGDGQPGNIHGEA